MRGEAASAMLSVRDLAHQFPPGQDRRRGGFPVSALRGVSFVLREGECLAVVGESGAGKTTLVRCLLRLLRPTQGEVRFRGADVLTMEEEDLLDFRRRAQMVFQDPFGSLNPRLRAGAMLRETLAVHGGLGSKAEGEARVSELLESVGLHPDQGQRYPHELSGGQRQRLSIARALSVGPELLILDEPVSALDLSIQAQVLTLLRNLRDRLALTLLLVAHDLAVVRQLADRVAVMYGGRFVEISPTESLFRDPVHPYSRGLLEAAGSHGFSGAGPEGWSPLPGEPPSPRCPPTGCTFHPRCPHPERDQECARRTPPLVSRTPGREVACWKETGGSNGA